MKDTLQDDIDGLLHRHGENGRAGAIPTHSFIVAGFRLVGQILERTAERFELQDHINQDIESRLARLEERA